MITGGSDSKIKVWQDSTAEEELKLKEEKLGKLKDEQNLSKLLRENDLSKAAVLAFKLNKLRDFFHVMNRIVSGNIVPPRAFIPGLMLPGVAQHMALNKASDPVESILLSKKSFEQAIETGRPQIETSKGPQELKKVFNLLLKEADIC